MRHLLLVASLLMACQPFFAQSQPPFQGRITGTVVNDSGEPIAQAMVCYSTVRPRQMTSGCRPADDQGRFDIEVPIETNRVYAQKPDEGYVSDNDLPKSAAAMNLTQAEPSAHLVLNVGPKAAQITVNVTAKDSGKPIADFRLRWFVISDDPAINFTYSTNEHVISVPSNKDVMLIVQAKGYRRWFCFDADDPAQPTLQLQPGEERVIDAALDPLPAKN